MPSVSPKQHRAMAMAAKNPAKAKAVGLKIPQKVAEEYLQADKGKKFPAQHLVKALTR